MNASFRRERTTSRGTIKVRKENLLARRSRLPARARARLSMLRQAQMQRAQRIESQQLSSWSGRTHHRIRDPRTRRAISQMSEARSLEANIGTATRRVGSACRAVDVTLCLAVSVSLPSVLRISMENLTKMSRIRDHPKAGGPTFILTIDTLITRVKNTHHVVLPTSTCMH